jgi:hypothetical protein
MICYELESSGFIVVAPSAGSAKHGDDSPSAYVWSYECVDFLHGQKHQVVVFVIWVLNALSHGARKAAQGICAISR